MVTITGVKVSPDLRSARVYFSVLGSEKEIAWAREESGLKLSVPAETPDEMAVVYKIETK
jgi:hypothetical protein